MNKCIALTALAGLMTGVVGCGDSNPVSAVVAPALARAKAQSDMIQVMKCGRNLYDAIIQAGIESRDMDCLAIFPRSEEAVSDDPSEITGKVFTNARDYFDALFDVKAAAADRNPYACVGIEVANYAEDGVPYDWIVAKGLDSTMPECVPVLISANIDAKTIRAALDNYTDNSTKLDFGSKIGRGDMALGDLGVVVIRKSGAADRIDAKHLTPRMLICGSATDVTFSGVKPTYLDVK